MSVWIVSLNSEILTQGYVMFMPKYEEGADPFILVQFNLCL